jgi:hypothetical protein
MRIAAATGFLILIAVSSGWLIHEYLTQPQEARLQTPDATELAPVPTIVAPPRPPVANTGGRLNAVITGHVTDQQTHLPIPEFTARLALGDSISPNTFQNAKQFKNGDYKVSINAASNRADLRCFVRIDARGYLPAISPPLAESAVQDFQLSRGRDLQGLVLTPDGTPAGGAIVAVATRTASVEIAAGNLTSRSAIQCVTDSAGKYDLPQQTEAFVLVALSPDGYAEVEQGTIIQDPDVRLARWAHIEGQLFIGTKPGVNEKIALSAGGAPRRPRIVHQMTITTHAAGTFQSDRIPPGVVHITHMVSTASGSNQRLVGSQGQTITIAAGQTISVKIGGDGRPMTGRLILPPALGNLTDYLFGGSLKSIGVSPPSSYGMQIHADGTFRVDDVRSGTYQITIQSRRLRGSSLPSEITADCTMPPIPGGVSDEPLVIPDIDLH